jgi:hypothetical protein
MDKFGPDSYGQLLAFLLLEHGKARRHAQDGFAEQLSTGEIAGIRRRLSSVLKSWRGLLLKLAVARFKRFVRRSLDY